MASKKYQEFTEFRSLLIRLIEDESKLTPTMVESMYEQLFLKPFIHSYADKEINEVYFFLANIKEEYKINSLKGLQEYFKRVDTMTGSLLGFIDSGANKKASEQIEKKVQEQLGNSTVAAISVLETLHYAITPNNGRGNAPIKLCEQVAKTISNTDSLAFRNKNKKSAEDARVVSVDSEQQMDKQKNNT